MTSIDVLDLYSEMNRHGIPIWIDGGWCVDALLGEQTRSHGDLDIAIEQKRVADALKVLEGRGYREVKRDSPWNFEMRDPSGRTVDFHAFVLDGGGHIVDGIQYPEGSRSGSGTIHGTTVRCIAPEFIVRSRAGHEPRKTDTQDVLALCKRFGIEIPAQFLKR